MDKIYIPIGSGCASATFLKQINSRQISLPFDWILSHLLFVNDIIKSIYDNSMEETLELFLDQHNTEVFSTITKEENDSLRYIDDFGNIHPQKFEYYRTLEKNESSDFTIHPYNRKYKVSFPHDSLNIEVDKYTRRLEKLKELLLNEDNFISFLYISPSSHDTHYCIDGEKLTINAGKQLNELCKYIETKRDNFNINFIDALEDSEILNDRINRIPVTPYKNWFPMIKKNNICLK